MRPLIGLLIGFVLTFVLFPAIQIIRFGFYPLIEKLTEKLTDKATKM